MMRRVLALTLVLACGVVSASSAQDTQDEGVHRFLGRLEAVAQRSDLAAYLALIAPTNDRQRAAAFASTELLPGVTRVAMVERDRAPLQGTLPGNGYRLRLDVMQEFGSRARVQTWRIDIHRLGEPGADDEWLISDQDRTASLDTLYNLSLNTAREFHARDLSIRQEDMELQLIDGSVFTVDTPEGTTALLFTGRGELRFEPRPEAERGQLRLFCGSERLVAPFDASLIRLSPLDSPQLMTSDHLVEVPVNTRDLGRADRVFRDEAPKAYAVDLGELSSESWSLLPAPGDFAAEIRTRHYGTLTYTRSGAQPEDVSLFERSRHKTIALYASREKLQKLSMGEDGPDYSIRQYDVDVSFDPDRLWIEGQARLTLTVEADALNSLSLRLAEPLAVRSVATLEFGRLFTMRIKRQGTLLINLPETLPHGTDLTLFITYSGRLEPQPPGTETVAPGQFGAVQTEIQQLVKPEPSFLYSNQTDWYPKPPVNQYATATMHVTVPAGFGCAATGAAEIDNPVAAPSGRATYAFRADAPVPYLAFLVARLERAWTVAISYPALTITVDASPRQVGRAHEVSDRARDIALFYSGILGGAPYRSLAIALIEADLPGGHSPAYFTALQQTLPTSTASWRNDPAYFRSYPEFFVAHEVAHQWWGQGVGWRSYHDQWLSEGLSQYFAALYAQRAHGDEEFQDVMHQMRKWAVDDADGGPIALGSRLGQLQSDSRVYRALVYDKAAIVLHMLRQLVGDDQFFAGLRRFYERSKFHTARTADFQRDMEAAAGRSLAVFFDRWIDGSALPRLTCDWHVEGSELVLHVEQLGGVFDLPLPLTLEYADKTVAAVVVPVEARVVDTRVPLSGQLRSVEAEEDFTLADIDVHEVR